MTKHPLRDKLVLKLDPLVKEHMSYQNTLLQSKTSLKQFCKQSSEEYSIKFDDSFLDQYGEYWFWESHCNRVKAEELLALVDDRTCKGG